MCVWYSRSRVGLLQELQQTATLDSAVDCFAFWVCRRARGVRFICTSVASPLVVATFVAGASQPERDPTASGDPSRRSYL